MAEDGQQQQKPSGTVGAEVSPEEQAERVERLRAIQWESLSSSRRDEITKADYVKNHNTPSLSQVEATRRVNKVGTEEWSTARERKVELSAWSTAWKYLQDDGTVDEDLEDIAGGQSHRIKLADAEARAREAGDNPYEDTKGRHKGGYEATRSGRARGGGVAGTRGRGDGRLADAEARAREAGDNPYEDTKGRHKGGYEATRSDRARGGGVAGTRGRGDGRRGSARGSAGRSMSTTTRPFGAFGNRAKTTARGDGGRGNRFRAFNPLSTTANSPSRGHAASRRTARGTTVSISSREQPPTSTDRQEFTTSQQPSPSYYEASLATPDNFMAEVHSRHMGGEAATVGVLSLPDANASNISSGAPGTTWQEVVEPNAASSNEGSVSQEGIGHPTTSLAVSEHIVGQEIDSASLAIRAPTPARPNATASEIASDNSHLIDLSGLEWHGEAPAGSRGNAAEFPAVASEDAEILARSVPDQIPASSDAWSQLAMLLPIIRSELDPSIVAQLEALAARRRTQSQTGGSARQTTSAVPLSRDRGSSKPESASMDTAGLSDRTTWMPQSQSPGKPLSYSSTRARDVPQEHPDTALGGSNVLSSTSSERAALPIAQDSPSSIDGLSSHVPVTLGPENDASTELSLIGSPPLEGDLTHSVYAPAGHAQLSFRIRRYASSRDHIIGEHLLPNSQRYSFGSPAALAVILPTATNVTPAANKSPESPTLQLRRVNLGPDNSEVAASRREAEEEIPAEAHTVGNSEPSIAVSMAALQYGPFTQALPSVASLSTEPRQAATVRTVHPTMRASNLTSSWDRVGDRPAASASASSGGVGSAAATTSSAPYGNASGRRGGHVRQPARQLPAFIANNPPPSADPGAAAARQYGLGRPLLPMSSPSTHPKSERDDPEPGNSGDLQAPIFTGPYTGPRSTDRRTLNSSGFLGPSNDVGSSNPSSGLGSKNDAWDMTRSDGYRW